MSIKVGFIGLGSLGAPMARRIARCRFPLVVYDISPAAVAALDEPGVEAGSDPIDTARRCEILCVCVRMDAELSDLAGDGSLFAALGERGLFVIHSTVAPELCGQLAETAKAYGVGVIDAGVSGGAPAALKGELAIYVGGEDWAIDKARALLECYGKYTALGPVGRGMQGKLLNNLISIANYGMSAAILDLGETLGFDRGELRELLLAGSAESFALRVVPNMLKPESAGPMRQLLGKDLDHARQLAPDTDVAMQALAAAAQSLIDRLERAAAQA